MKTKLVYVLTSSPADRYLEQALMSVHSARMYNPEAHITLVTETDTRQSCEDGLRKDFLTYFDEVIVVDVSQYGSMYHRSRALKTTLREHVSGDYLFIDGDTIICEPLDEIDSHEEPLAFALDMHITKEHWGLFFNDSNMLKAFGTADTDKHFNSGVSLVKDSPETHHFYKVWHEEWRKTMAQDQPPLHTAIVKTGIKVEELDGRWNCQTCGCFLPYLYKAKILHTFASAHYLDCPCQFREPNLLNEIREHGALTTRAKSLIQSPKEAFAAVNMTLGQQAIGLVKSPVMEHTAYFYKHYRPLYHVMERVAKLLRGLCDIINWIRVHSPLQ